LKQRIVPSLFALWDGNRGWQDQLSHTVSWHTQPCIAPYRQPVSENFAPSYHLSYCLDRALVNRAELECEFTHGSFESKEKAIIDHLRIVGSLIG
jgi:hypothetical protein